MSGFALDTAADLFGGDGRKVTFDERRSEWHRGLHIWIEVNGWTFSATWDRGTYCTGARPGGRPHLDTEPFPSSPDAEIAAWRGDGEFIDLHGNSVEGWVTPESFLAAIEAAERDDEAAVRAALIRSDLTEPTKGPEGER